ncbi:MAG: hypothetical protein Q7O66_14900 [Dehalococcoidia bacterium]|nr:hypothetical protein [Dehalococcoidia bacterium]
MSTSETSSEEHLRRLVNEYSDDRVSLLEILRFWGRHPSTRFNQPAILNSLDCMDPGHVRSALTYLINKEVVVENNQARCYQLTESEPLRSELLSLSRHDWSQQNLIQNQLIQRGEIYA